MRVLVAGFKHETNTFASNRADWAAFERGESFPKPTHGDAMLEMISKVDVSASGFASVAKRHGWTLVPSLWAGAVPSSYITDDAFERICDTILRDVKTLTYDAIYLELHGAAMSESFDDAEGELLARIHAEVEPGIGLHLEIERAPPAPPHHALADHGGEEGRQGIGHQDRTGFG